jgi:hypothetical protein
MKFILATLGILGAGLFGYVLEPDLRYSLTGMAPTPAAVPPTLPSLPTVQPVAPTAPTYDYAALQPNQLPEKIVLKAQAFATAPGETDAVPLNAGTKVKPLRIEDTEVHFSVLGTAQGKIAVAQTNLVETLLANPPPPPVVATVETTPPVVTIIEPPMPQPMPEPAPQSEPAPAPAPIASAATLSAEDIVKVMQESIRSGQIKEFTFDQVLGWKATEQETVDGQTFLTGLAAYKAETIFGVKNIQAKALILDGKVIRWIWPTSGLEIE